MGTHTRAKGPWNTIIDELKRSDSNVIIEDEGVGAIIFSPDDTETLRITAGVLAVTGSFSASGGITNVSSIQFDTSYSGAHAEGLLHWNADDGTLEVGMPGGDVVLQLGQEIHLRAKNTQGVQINNGESVYVSGASGSRPEVKLADNDTGNPIEAWAIGVATENIANNQSGYITTFGLVRDMDTSGPGIEVWADGDFVWLDDTAGQLTNVRPTAPKWNVFMGEVLRAHASEGILFVKVKIVPRLIGLSDTDITAPTVQGQFFSWDTDNSRFELQEDVNVTLNTSGFEDASVVALSSDGGNPPTITLTFTGTVYFWSDGIRYSKTGSENIQISDVSGIHVVYYDGSTLTTVANPSNSQTSSVIEDKAIVMYIYFNANDNSSVLLANELHGIKMSGVTHHYLHDTIGFAFESGGGLSAYTLDTASDAAISFDLGNMEIHDEDITVDIIDGLASTQYSQVLTGDAELPVAYRDTVDQTWTLAAASTLPYLVGGNTRLQYMDKDNSWALTEVGVGKFCSYFIVATNDWQYPIRMIPGNQEYANANDAEDNAPSEAIDFGNATSEEATVLYQLIMQHSVGGTKNAKIISIIDFRFANIAGADAGGGASDHGGLSGLADDDHTQYVLVDGTRDIAIAPAGVFSITDTDGDNLAVFTSNGSVELYHNNIKTFETQAAGISITDGTATAATIGFSADDLDISNNDVGGLLRLFVTTAGGQKLFFAGGANGESILYNAGNQVLQSNSSGGVSLGSGVTTHMYSAGGNFMIDHTIAGDTFTLQGEKAATGNSVLAKFDPDGAAQLYHAGALTFSTMSDGVVIESNFDIKREGTKFAFENNYDTGLIELRGNATGEKVMAIFDPAGATELYYAGVKKFETNASGAWAIDQLQVGPSGEQRLISSANNVTVYNAHASGGCDLLSAAGYNLRGVNNAATELYYAGTKTFETQAAGVNVTDATDTAHIEFASNILRIDNVTSPIVQIHGNDTALGAQFNGAGAGIIYYAGAGALYTTSVGIQVRAAGSSNLDINAGAAAAIKNSVDGGTITIEGDHVAGGGQAIMFVGDPDGASELYHAGNKMLGTTGTSDGGVIFYTEAGVDNLYIYHGGANTFIATNAAGGDLILQTTGENAIVCTDDGPVDIYHDGLIQFGSDVDGLLMAASKSIEFNPVPTNDHEWSGEMTTLQVDTNATGFGAALYMASDGNLDESDADAAATMPVRALALEAGTGAGKKVLFRGFIRDDTWAWTVGGTIYADVATGGMTQTAPAGSGDQVQVLGFATHADRMYFNPEYTLIEVA